jgi:hypothetical protein
VFFDGVIRKEVEGVTFEAYSIFKKGIRPEWEDPANQFGSDLCCRKLNQFDMADTYWENLVFGTFLSHY